MQQTDLKGYLLIDSNLADSIGVIYVSTSEFIGYDSKLNVTFSSNMGSLVAFNSNITFVGVTSFVNNHPSQATTDDFQGGAITLFRSNLVLMEHVILITTMLKMVERYILLIAKSMLIAMYP